MRSELRDAQIDRNRTNSQLENARVEKNESQGQLESATGKYQRLKGQFDKQRSALADLSNQQEQEQHHDAEQLSSELVEPQIVQSSPSQQANQEARGPWEDAQHVQQQHSPNSHTRDRNSPQGPPVHSLETHSSASMIGGDPPVMGEAQQQQQQQCPLTAPTLDLPQVSSNSQVLPTMQLPRQVTMQLQLGNKMVILCQQSLMDSSTLRLNESPCWQGF